MRLQYRVPIFLVRGPRPVATGAPGSAERGAVTVTPAAASPDDRLPAAVSTGLGPWPVGVTPTREYQAALEHVREGAGNLFVTGRAGTGKSTLLRCLAREAGERCVIVAPTGLAAVNVGGQTIHSFFGLPPRLIRPDDIRRGRNGRLMRKLDLLVIDEISMVRSDLMWAIDQSLRLNRGRPREPFGGLNLLLFGDMHQLPPVVQDGEVARHLEDAHGGPFFFNHSALRDGGGTALLELEQVFRQKDEQLLSLLNTVREGESTDEELALLNERVNPVRTLAEGDPYVILTPTNAAASRINLAYLDALPGTPQAYQASVAGEFSANAHPTDPTLVLKIGAKVILLRNDSERRWVNGSIARISKLSDSRVWVEIDGREHEIEPASWESRRYAFDTVENKIVETVAGSFKQFPLRLAWALTIHKSQGLTLDKVYIDLGRGTFAHGQTYVALSRCRTLEGLALARPLRQSDLQFDRTATDYRRLFDPLSI
jgi:ATP-dependent exoDNAse (exonuclease V) alpha subunit